MKRAALILVLMLTACGDQSAFDVPKPEIKRSNFIVSVKQANDLPPNVLGTATWVEGASVTTTISIPKYTHLIGVTTRVTTAIGTTNGTTGYQVGDGTDADLWGAITGTAQGTTSDRRDFTAVDALGPDGADRTITLTAVGGNFDGTGVIEVCAYYLAAEAD